MIYTDGFILSILTAPVYHMLGRLAAAYAHIVQMLLLKGDAAGLDAVCLFLQLVLTNSN